VLAYALPAAPETLDPLAASLRSAQLVSRQIHEPLVSRLHGPYGATARRPGLAISWKPSRDRTIWTFRLRPRVRFQDGTPFNAAAVLANARRWISLPAGQRIVPELFAVDAPRPEEVRFVLRTPVPDLPRRLDQPRLGLVSPEAIRPRSGEQGRFLDNGDTGTGPYKRTRSDLSDQYLGRHASWWGSSEGLGPALDGIDFRFVADQERRVDLLRGGEVQVADGLGKAQLAAVASNPLLAAVREPGGGVGLQRSVRGIESATAVESLSEVWLTTVNEQ
jgi:ABC-type transport system substrate-binding protein